MMTTAVGTPAYMAPELASTDATVATFSSAVDIYALEFLVMQFGLAMNRSRGSRISPQIHFYSWREY